MGIDEKRRAAISNMPKTLLDMSPMMPLPMGTVFCAVFFGAVWLLWAVLDLLPFLLSLVRGCEKRKSDDDNDNDDDCGKALYDAAKLNKYSPLQLNIHSIVLLLRQTSLLGLILFMGWINEYTPLFPHSAKQPDLDYYLFLSVGFIIVAFMTIKETKDNGILNRNQTEEWKGWMQMQFLMYHYLHQEETYNSIRVYISCYVWMTGFGNFSFFYTKRDYSFVRFWSMMWRLNFSVFWLCLAMNNTYILYYICPLHTFFFLVVFFTMRVGESTNHTQWGVRAKVFGLCVLLYLVWEFDSVWLMLWSVLPTSAQLGAKYGVTHEWHFRSFLDHWDSAFGMMFALNFPMMVQWFEQIEGLSAVQQFRAKAAVGTIFGFALALWFKYVFFLPKFEYNHIHPYTFFVPLLSYVFYRNCSKYLRSFNLDLLVSMGKITLETYLLQHHFWLTSNAKSLLTIIPGYPKLNFVVATLFFVTCSNTLFRSTMALRGMMIPQENSAALKYLGGMLAAGAAVLAVSGGVYVASPGGAGPTSLLFGSILISIVVLGGLFQKLSSQIEQHANTSSSSMLGFFAFVCLWALGMGLFAANRSVTPITEIMPLLKPLPATASEMGAPAEGFGVLILLVIGLVSADNFCGSGWIGSMCAGAPWPTFASVYDDFNAKIVAKQPFVPFWAPPMAVNSADSEEKSNL